MATRANPIGWSHGLIGKDLVIAMPWQLNLPIYFRITVREQKEYKRASIPSQLIRRPAFSSESHCNPTSAADDIEEIMATFASDTTLCSPQHVVRTIDQIDPLENIPHTDVLRSKSQ
jgi:hypothetical protein